MRHVLIDCDPGHDDALAIMTALAHPEEMSILGITTVGGNQTLQKVTKNAGNLLGFLHAKVPLASGQAQPLVKELMPARRRMGTAEWMALLFPGWIIR